MSLWRTDFDPELVRLHLILASESPHLGRIRRDSVLCVQGDSISFAASELVVDMRPSRMNYAPTPGEPLKHIDPRARGILGHALQ